MFSLMEICFQQAPIYVNKQIVMTDAIKISFATGRVRDSKSTYDVSLDRYQVYVVIFSFATITHSKL